MLTGRIMALDVGDRRIGVAISDPSGLIASTLEPLDRSDPYYSTDLVIRLAMKNDVAEILVGMPLLLSGKEGSSWEYRVSENSSRNAASAGSTNLQVSQSLFSTTRNSMPTAPI